MQEIPWRLAKGLYSKKERETSGLTVAEGPPSVTSALESGVQLEFIITSDSFINSGDYKEVERLIAGRTEHPRFYVATDALYARMSEIRSPQGIMCVLPYPFRYPNAGPIPPWETPLYVYAFDIQDPGNAGTLIRAAAAAGVTEVVFCGDGVDVFSPKCIRASAGAAFKVRLCEKPADTDPVAILEDLESAGITVYKTSPRGGRAPWDAAFTKACAIVVGNEARGLSERVLGGPGESITIPMPGDTESLNVAIASGAILYEAVRQRLVSKRAL